MRLENPFVRVGQRTVTEVADVLEAVVPAGNDNAMLRLDVGAVFERVVAAYGGGTLSAVQGLLSTDLYRRLHAELAERTRLGQVLHSWLARVDSILQLPESDPRGHSVDYRISFCMVVALRDAEGRLLAGDPGRALAFTEVWTFERRPGAMDWRVANMIEDE